MDLDIETVAEEWVEPLVLAPLDGKIQMAVRVLFEKLAAEHGMSIAELEQNAVVTIAGGNVTVTTIEVQ